MITDFNLTPDTTRKVDRELREKVGVEIDHEPFLSEKFSNLIMEDATA